LLRQLLYVFQKLVQINIVKRDCPGKVVVIDNLMDYYNV